MKNIGIYQRFFLIGIITIGLLGMNNAYAVVPTIILFEANDPDDGDTVFSVGDTILIRFNAGVNATNGGSMTSAEFAANFTVTSPASFDGTFSGVWSNPDANGPQDLLLTWTAIGSNTPTVSTTTIDDNAATTNLFDAATTTDKFVEDGTDTLTGDFGLFVAVSVGSGDGCDGDCQAPTLGVNNDGRRLVENGFTYNGKQIDVERFFTPYPLIKVNVGIQNTAVFKIYDNLGPDNIRHFDLAFGLASGQIMGTSNAMIQWDRSFDGIETVTIVDPHNVLDNVRIDTLEGKCRTDSSTDDCLIVIVNHTFRAPLESDIVATNVWDQRRNAWQNYYNHGISIEGKSLNPPNEYVGIYKGNLIHLIEIGKNIAVDGQDNIWTFDKVWKKDYIPKAKIDDGISAHGYDRNHVKFSNYKYGQELLAKQILDEFCPKCGIEPFEEIGDVKFYRYPDTIYKLDDPIVQKMLEHENEKAMKTLQKMFDEMYNHDYKRIEPFQSD